MVLAFRATNAAGTVRQQRSLTISSEVEPSIFDLLQGKRRPVLDEGYKDVLTVLFFGRKGTVRVCLCCYHDRDATTVFDPDDLTRLRGRKVDCRRPVDLNVVVPDIIYDHGPVPYTD